MREYASEFLQVAVAHALAVASPGPDFAIVLRQSLVHGRRTAIWTGLGIGTAILLHVGYSLLGLGLLLRGSALWFEVVKYGGAAYLAWLGGQSLFARPRPATAPVAGGADAPSTHGAFVTGFLTNVLNPKVALFFISLFALVVSPRTPKLIQAGYGLWMSLVTMAWFSLVAVLFTRERTRAAFLRRGPLIDRALGAVFLALAASLVFARR